MHWKFIHKILLLWKIYKCRCWWQESWTGYVCGYQGSNDHYGYENWENHLENFFSNLSLTFEQKCCYTQMKLAGEVYWWWKDNHKFCWCWFVLQDFLRTRYAPHILHASKADCKKLNVEYELELELERPHFSDLVVKCKKIKSCWSSKVRARSESQNLKSFLVKLL